MISQIWKLSWSILFAHISLTVAGGFCDRDDNHGSTYCSYGCCRTNSYDPCCDRPSQVPAIAGTVTGIVVAIVIMFVICCCCCRRRREHMGTVVSTTPQQHVTVMTVQPGSPGFIMAPQTNAYPTAQAAPFVNSNQALPQSMVPSPNVQPPPYQPHTEPLTGSQPYIPDANTLPPSYQAQAATSHPQSDDSYIHPVSETAHAQPYSGGYINTGMNDESDSRRNQPMSHADFAAIDDGYEEPVTSGYEEPVTSNYEHAIQQSYDHCYEELNFNRET